MTPETAVKFRKLIEARRSELVALCEASSEARAAVALDSQVMGRLSRQDALQQQAMAKASDARRKAQINRLNAALRRLDAGEFGWCAACGEAIAPRRLEIDPTAELCVDCAGG